MIPPKPTAQVRSLERPLLHAHLAGVSLVGILVLGLVLPALPVHLQHATLPVALLFAFVLAGELLPIKLPGHDDEVTTSAPFMYALLLACGPAIAIPAQIVASIVADVRGRKAPLAIAFNVGQFSVALAAAGGVASALGAAAPDGPRFAFTAADFPALVAVGATFFVCNNLLAGTAAALAQDEPIVRSLLNDLRFQAAMAAVVTGLTPLVIAVADHHAAVIPLLVLPLIVLHRGTRAARLNEYQASHDSLTGLPNRKLFRARVEEALARARRGHRLVALLVMDLDRFKEVNDTLGHHHGDLLLERVGDRLRDVLRPEDVIARFGGDEFAVLVEEVRDTEAAEDVARRLLTALERPFDVDGVTLEVGASIGVVCAPEHGNDVDTLLQHGDVAMYIAKAGHFGWALYEPSRDGNSVDRLALAGQLRKAFERDELVLHYQPQVDVASGAVVGVEALVRWQHPERGLLSPAAFVPLAEHTGLIRPLTLRALELATAQAAAWRRAGIRLKVAVNVSSRDVLDPRLVTEIGGLLTLHELPAGALALEVTESTLMVDPRRAQTILEEISARGVSVAVDDFGTGYSSLAYLKRLPIDTVKIDRSFVSGMTADASDAAIVASTIDLGRNLGLNTVAEGVEDGIVYERLRELGCTVAQGYWLSRPAPAADIERWLERRAGEAARFPAAA